MHAKRVCKDFEINIFGEYLDLYLHSNTLLLAGVFENFRKYLFRNLSVRPCKISFSPCMSLVSHYKKTEVKLELLTDIDMLLMVEKGIRGGICQSINRYVKVNNKYMTEYDKNKESLHLKYLDVSNLYGCEMSQKLSVTNF